MALGPQLHKYVLAAAAPVVDRRGIGWTPLLGSNDSLPDCTAVAYFNCAIAASWAITGVPTATLEAKAPSFYAECIGNPTASAADLAATDGAMIQDVLEHQVQHGCDVGQQTRLVAHYGVIGPSDRMGIAGSIEHLGACDLGIRLYQRDMDTVFAGVWDDDGTADPGPLVGLHSLIAWDYLGLADDAMLRLGTWGNWQPATWRWLSRRVDEAHGLLWRQFAVPGVDYATLQSDVDGFVA